MTTTLCRLDALEVSDARGFVLGGPGAWRKLFVVRDADGVHGYQNACPHSRGPLEWVEPSTEAELARAGRDGVPVVVAPIAFVSEHSETLVELDIECRKLAVDRGVPAYVRVPALGTAKAFIAGLAGLARRLAGAPPGLCSEAGGRLCPAGHAGCPQYHGSE